ncbi:hypothetical protein BS47DRAFT_1356164 [Hydnum rufescens UP504]|uniref:G domain-containing protein n=1 Tax=Hydnum rufescens UP504 TaxID=1448309 RepID=A0A9P6DLW2_9AGAM|nr:hypothetical protein BS47DRAFT_1356164 [Hydnum rufescens UP504]
MFKFLRKHFKHPNKLTKKGFIKKEVPDGPVHDEAVPDEEVPREEVPNVPGEESTDGEVPDEEVPDEVSDEEVPDEVSDEEDSDEEVSDEERVTRRFRVLILGPANAGKTTLLERLTDSPAGASIVTRDGKRIEEVPRAYDQRGIHTIDDEITYKSNPDLVFHDSGGFEAGGVEEVEAVWQFIRKRSVASPLQQLHAIWLCIPTDNDRPFGFLHSGFFSEPTASVPVIGIFTKLDGRKTKIMAEVLGPASEPSNFLDRALEVEQKVAEFVNRLETQFRNQRYPPAGFLRVGNMHEVTEQSIALCNQLLGATMDALPNETQRSLLHLTVWKRNRRIHTIHVLQR